MREDESNWFSKWEEDLPSPDELMPLSQTLITPDLALAFDIRNSSSNPQPQLNTQPPPLLPPVQTLSSQPNSGEFESSEFVGGASGDEPARTLKRPRLVWTPQLHKRFVDAVAHLGIKNAVPKTIMQLMSVDGLTRENVASHLQKYRLYLKRMQGLSNGGGGIASAGDAATDRLFASSPVPAHFLNPGRPSSEHFLPFVPVAALQQQQMAAAAAVAGHQQYRHMGHFGSPPNGQFGSPANGQFGSPANGQFGSPQNGQFGSPQNGQFELPFLARQTQQQQQQVHRMGTPVHNSVPSSYVEDLESATAAANGRKVLTLFPTGDQ